jgi:type IV fimbrial biogenesis protein FimT
MNPRHISGVTLVELLVTIAVLAVLASVAVPSLTTVLQNNAITANANALVTGFAVARSEALKREIPVTICRTDAPNAATPDCGAGDGWQEGWVVFADADGDGVFDGGEVALIRETGMSSSSIRIVVDSGDAPLDESLTYLPTGFADFPTSVEGGRNLLFCDARESDAAARVINVSQTGRTRIRVLNDIGDIGLSCE